MVPESDGATSSLILICMPGLIDVLNLSKMSSLINNVDKEQCPYMSNVFSKQVGISAESMILLTEILLLTPACILLFGPFSINALSTPLDMSFFFC